MRILVAHASVRGATAELARAVADELGAAGHAVDLRDVADVDELAPWDAVVVGAALYASLWPRRARRFVAWHADELARMPVWLFSSGPLDDSASRGELPPTPSVARVLRRLAARGHRTFGGRLAPDARGFIASAMAKRLSGDFRDMHAARAWARTIAAALAELPAPRARAPVPATRRVRHAVVGLCTFTGVTALAGGLQLALWPAGAGWGPFADTAVLRGTPFADFRGPGLLLALGVAAPNLIAAVLAARRSGVAAAAAAVGGAAITIWIAVQMLLLRTPHVLHAIYLAVGAATIGLAARLYVVRRAAIRARAA